MYRQLGIVVFLLTVTGSQTLLQAQTASPVEVAKLGETPNVHMCGKLFLAGQPRETDIPIIKTEGIKRIVTLRTDEEVDWDEAAVAIESGLEFIKLPLGSPDALTDEVFEQVRGILRESDKNPVLLHCRSAHRVGAVWYAYRVLDEGVDAETAMREATQVGLKASGFRKRATQYVSQQAATRAEATQEDSKQQASINPGINDNFLQADLKIDEWLGRFEVESREVYSARDEVLAAIGIASGQRIADVGTGTGLYTKLFSGVVGDSGWVYAIDIAPRFLQHINQRAAEERLNNVSTMLCSADSIALPPNSIDFAFVCDTYHHFEFPHETVSSIRRALKSGGYLIVIDFERIPGRTREWLLNHVRAGKQEFRGEIEAAGFEFVEEERIAGFEENYFLRFRRK